MTETRIIIRRSEVKSVRAVMDEYEQLCKLRPLSFESGVSVHRALAILKEYINKPISIDVLVNVIEGEHNLDENEGVQQIMSFISEMRVTLHLYVQLWHITHGHWAMTRETMIASLFDQEGLPTMPLQWPSASIIIE